jgi:hypothetical protein
MGVAGIAPLPRCAVKRSRAAPKRDAYLHCTTQSGQEGAPVCGSRPRPRLFFVASTSRTRQVGHDAPRRAAGGPVVRRGAACCPCWFTGTPSNRKRRAPALPMLRATRRARTMTRGGTSRGPRRGAARRTHCTRSECCTERRPCARCRARHTAAPSATCALRAGECKCASMRRRWSAFWCILAWTFVQKVRQMRRTPRLSRRASLGTRCGAARLLYSTLDARWRPAVSSE